MNKLIALFVLPLLAAMITAILLLRFTVFEENFSPVPAAKIENTAGIYIDKFDNSPEKEAMLFEENDGQTITIFGSSELSHSGPAAPQIFIPQHSPFRVRSFGHAGNQCLSMLCQLLAKENQLKNSKVVFIISPGWFESKASLGTNSTVFLEYNSDRMLKNWVENKNEEAVYARKRMAGFFKDFNSPGTSLRKQYFTSIAETSLIHALAMGPVFLAYKIQEFFCVTEEKPGPTKKPDSQPALTYKEANWDSLLNYSAEEVKSRSRNNNYGINDQYFSEFIGNKRGKIQAVPRWLNTELYDFKHLLNYIAEKKLNACFIISPMNALYYENLETLDPLIEELDSEIKKAGFPLLNLFTSEKEKYKKEMLSDVMHLSDYGWYTGNRFIIRNFSNKN